MFTSFKSFILAATAAAAFCFAAGCVSDAQTPGDDGQTAAPTTSETEQDIGGGGGGGGGGCPAKDNCYSLCRFVHNCAADSSQCAPLAECLDSCDAEFPSC